MSSLCGVQLLGSRRDQPQVRIPKLGASTIGLLQEPETYGRLKLGLHLTRIPTDVHTWGSGAALRYGIWGAPAAAGLMAVFNCMSWGSGCQHYNFIVEGRPGLGNALESSHTGMLQGPVVQRPQRPVSLEYGRCP